MGPIKEKMLEIAELIQLMLDEGVQDSEVDEYLEVQLTPEDYEFYHQNKDVIFQHFLGYMGESFAMPLVESEYEENWEDEDGEEEYNDDDLADYEWSVGSALTAQLEDQGISIDSDNLGDALYDQMGFILQCMKDDMNPLDCAVELINNEEFMSNIRVEDDDDYEDFEDYDDMDESIKMPKLDEGCNCGKKRPIPNIIRRPAAPVKTASRPIIRRPMPKKLHEKFTPKSDPIKDMGIGKINLKKEAEKFFDDTRGNMNTIGEKYFNDRKMIADSIFKNHGIKVNPQDKRLIESFDNNYVMEGLFNRKLKSDEADPMADVYSNALILARIFKESGKPVSPSGLGRGKHGSQNIALDMQKGPTYEFQISRDGEVTYMGVFGQEKNPVKIGNILDEKSLKDGLYRYMRLGSQEQYESTK